MTPRKRPLVAWTLMMGLAVGLAWPADLAAQGRAGRPAVAPDPDVMSVQQVEDYFDQVVLRQARVNLSLGEGQLPRFGAGLRRLQAVRRQAQRQRMSVVRELNVLLGRAPFDETAAAARLQELDEVTRRADDEVRAAYEAIDRVLDLRQRARFRVFEQAMERRKLELLTRARQQARPSDGRPE